MDEEAPTPGLNALFPTLGAAKLADWMLPERIRAPLRQVVRTLRDAATAPAGPAADPPEPEVAAGAAFVEGVHAEEAGSRRYRLYLPASLAGGPPRGLVMMLHGCGQTPEDFAVGTGMNRLAEARRLVVVYPGQSRADNGKGCWNWFRPGDQRRDAGEPAILAGLARTLAAEHGVPPGRIFVAGLSAGGAMAAVLGSAYPDVFAAVGVHSGVPHGSSSDAFSALAAMRGDRLSDQPPAGLPVPAIVFHGDADDVVHPSNAARLADAGRADDEPHPGRTGSAGGRRFLRRVEPATDGAQALEFWLVEGGGHAWSGGNPDGSFADAAGPDASAEMVRFFLGRAGRRGR